jgi:hypothetical protein
MTIRKGIKSKKLNNGQMERVDRTNNCLSNTKQKTNNTKLIFIVFAF